MAPRERHDDDVPAVRAEPDGDRPNDDRDHSHHPAQRFSARQARVLSRRSCFRVIVSRAATRRRQFGFLTVIQPH